MSSTSYQCPFCNHHSTIAPENMAVSHLDFFNNNRHGPQHAAMLAITCPNDDCREFKLIATLQDRILRSGGAVRYGPIRHTWPLVPQSGARPVPGYVPEPIAADYREACAIRDLSPKASATLARRCLQGMIRDFWGISLPRLKDEVDSLEEKVDGLTWAAVDAVRTIGNVGAHMERDINVIVDVEPEEAGLLIGLIETLIEDWYVSRHDREERVKKVIASAADKAAKAKGLTPIPDPASDPETKP